MVDKNKLPSRHVSVGPKSAPHRAFYHAMGITEEQIKLEKKNWLLLDAQRIYIENSFDFIGQNPSNGSTFSRVPSR